MTDKTVELDNSPHSDPELNTGGERGTGLLPVSADGGAAGVVLVGPPPTVFDQARELLQAATWAREAARK